MLLRSGTSPSNSLDTSLSSRQLTLNLEQVARAQRTVQAFAAKALSPRGSGSLRGAQQPSHAQRDLLDLISPRAESPAVTLERKERVERREILAEFRLSLNALAVRLLTRHEASERRAWQRVELNELILLCVQSAESMSRTSLMLRQSNDFRAITDKDTSSLVSRTLTLREFRRQRGNPSEGTTPVGAVLRAGGEGNDVCRPSEDPNSNSSPTFGSAAYGGRNVLSTLWILADPVSCLVDGEEYVREAVELETQEGWFRIVLERSQSFWWLRLRRAAVDDRRRSGLREDTNRRGASLFIDEESKRGLIVAREVEARCSHFVVELRRLEAAGRRHIQHEELVGVVLHSVTLIESVSRAKVAEAQQMRWRRLCERETRRRCGGTDLTLSASAFAPSTTTTGALAAAALSDDATEDASHFAANPQQQNGEQRIRSSSAAPPADAVVVRGESFLLAFGGDEEAAGEDGSPTQDAEVERDAIRVVSADDPGNGLEPFSTGASTIVVHTDNEETRDDGAAREVEGPAVAAVHDEPTEVEATTRDSMVGSSNSPTGRDAIRNEMVPVGREHAATQACEPPADPADPASVSEPENTPSVAAFVPSTILVDVQGRTESSETSSATTAVVVTTEAKAPQIAEETRTIEAAAAKVEWGVSQNGSCDQQAIRADRDKGFVRPDDGVRTEGRSADEDLRETSPANPEICRPLACATVTVTGTRDDDSSRQATLGSLRDDSPAADVLLAENSRIRSLAEDEARIRMSSFQAVECREHEQLLEAHSRGVLCATFTLHRDKIRKRNEEEEEDDKRNAAAMERHRLAARHSLQHLLDSESLQRAERAMRDVCARQALWELFQVHGWIVADRSLLVAQLTEAVSLLSSVETVYRRELEVSAETTFATQILLCSHEGVARDGIEASEARSWNDLSSAFSCDMATVVVTATAVPVVASRERHVSALISTQGEARCQLEASESAARSELWHGLIYAGKFIGSVLVPEEKRRAQLDAEEVAKRCQVRDALAVMIARAAVAPAEEAASSSLSAVKRGEEVPTAAGRLPPIPAPPSARRPSTTGGGRAAGTGFGLSSARQVDSVLSRDMEATSATTASTQEAVHQQEQRRQQRLGDEGTFVFEAKGRDTTEELLNQELGLVGSTAVVRIPPRPPTAPSRTRLDEGAPFFRGSSAPRNRVGSARVGLLPSLPVSAPDGTSGGNIVSPGIRVSRLWSASSSSSSKRLRGEAYVSVVVWQREEELRRYREEVLAAEAWSTLMMAFELDALRVCV